MCEKATLKESVSALSELIKDLMAASVSICRGLGACSLALQEVER